MDKPLWKVVERALDAALIDQWESESHEAIVAAVTALEASNASLQQRVEALEREHAWMRRIFLSMDSTRWMKWVEGPWYATGDMDELAFFRAIRNERIYGLAAAQDKEQEDEN